MTALNRKTLQSGSSRPDQDLPRWMHADPNHNAIVGCFWMLVFTAVAALVVLLGAAALSWLAGLFGGAL